MSAADLALADEAGAGARSGSIIGWIIAAGLLAAGLVGFILPDTGWFTAVPGDPGDARFNSIVLEHLFRVLTGQGGSLWNPDFFYPYKGMLALSDNHFGSIPVYILARLLGLGREHAIDAWFIVGFILNYAVALYVLRRLGFDTAAAAIGAFVFAFALPALAQDNHAQLTYRFGMPLAALAYWQAFQHKRLVNLAAVAFWTTWQFYVAIYLGIFTVYLLGAMTVAILLIVRPLDLRAWVTNVVDEPAWRKIAAALVMALCAAALAYLFTRYIIVSRTYHLDRPLGEITNMLPRWASYLLADRVPYIRDMTSLLKLPMQHEHQLFIGFAALALLLVGAVASYAGWTRRATLGRVMVVALLLLIFGTLWINELSLYYLIVWLPGISSMRAVSRVILVMLVPMSILVAIGVGVLARQTAARSVIGWVTAAVLAVLVTIEPLSMTTMPWPISDWQYRMSSIRDRLSGPLPPDAILWVRTGGTSYTDVVVTELDGMMLAQDMGVPTLNGYSGYQPPGYMIPNSCVPPDLRLKGYAEFTHTDVSDLVRRVVTVDVSPCQK